jgi:type II restriction enzyme
MATKLNAQQLFNKLVNTDQLVGKQGTINFDLNNFSIKIESKDIIGNVIQDWLKAWLTNEGVHFVLNTNTQKFPDIYLDTPTSKNGLLEIKTFDFKKSPNFDIANFDSYCSSVETDSYRIDSDYLILGYEMQGSNIFVRNIWLKKIWEIAGPSKKWPLKVQDKRNIIYNIRPTVWYSSRGKFKAFGTKELFLKALNDTRYQYPQTRFQNAHWLNNVITNYHQHTGVTLVIP